MLRLPDGDVVHGTVDSKHAAQLTRADVTAAVHYLGFELTGDQVAAFGPGLVLAIEHPRYLEQTELSPATVSELISDLRGD